MSTRRTAEVPVTVGGLPLQSLPSSLLSSCICECCKELPALKEPRIGNEGREKDPNTSLFLFATKSSASCIKNDTKQKKRHPLINELETWIERWSPQRQSHKRERDQMGALEREGGECHPPLPPTGDCLRNCRAPLSRVSMPSTSCTANGQYYRFPYRGRGHHDEKKDGFCDSCIRCDARWPEIALARCTFPLVIGPLHDSSSSTAAVDC